MTVIEKDFTLSETWSADEAFVTGTLGGVTPVTKIDARMVGDGKPGAGEALHEMQNRAAHRRRSPGGRGLGETLGAEI